VEDLASSSLLGAKVFVLLASDPVTKIVTTFIIDEGRVLVDHPDSA
jgi:hypothetical protein